MVVLLPGYTYFRYPAKLLVLASLGISGLSAIGLDRLLAGHRDRFRWWLAAVGLASLLTGGLVAASGPWWAGWLAGAGPDELFGPLDMRGGWRDAIVACLHTAVVCGAGWWACRTQAPRPTGLAWVLLGLTALDLAWANHWMVQTAPAAAMESPALLDDAASAAAAPRIYRAPNRRWVVN